MGESKRRRESDQFYGKVAKDDHERGLVISVPMELEGSLVSIEGALDAQELRYSLLFWEKLIWPQTGIFGYAEGEDIEALTSAGILSKPMIHVGAGEWDGAALLAMAQIETFKQLEAREPGRWSLAQGDRSFRVVGKKGDEVPGATVELYKAIPIPSHEVPIAEILEFKHRRTDELRTLRFHLDQLAKEISFSNDPNEALRINISNIDSACSDLIKLGKEWKFPMKLSSVKATLNLDPTKLVVSTATAFWSTQSLGLPISTAVAGLAAVGSIVNIKADIGYSQVRPRNSPFQYALRIEQDLN